MKKFYRNIIISFSLLVFLETASWLTLGFAEFYSRQFKRYDLKSHLNLYQQVDPSDAANWILVPNYRSTFEEFMKQKAKEGRWLTVGLLKDALGRNEFLPGENAISINSFGFRGNETSIDKKYRIRILCLGDSVTFGFPGEPPYPDAISKELLGRGYSVEVINAGVEGYAIDNLRKRFSYYCKFKPDVVIFYIGWNNLYSEESGHNLERGFLDKAQHYSNFLRLGTKIINLMRLALTRSAHCKPGTLQDKEYRKVEINFNPVFTARLEVLIRDFKEKDQRTKIVLLTLPSLFDPYRQPDNQTLSIGHLPEFTNNAFVLASMVYIYNDSLRRLAKGGGYYLIDLEKYSDDKLNPKNSYFFDSCHLYPKAYKLIGNYIAEGLIKEKIID
ncbi:MAG: SGNH/GDSL hydrolase family protein [Candidatus Omnitrophica bacterium]|nr:SGNH/GDSL hydrolase family protein [Candidatus Omnitrophota bacterium]